MLLQFVIEPSALEGLANRGNWATFLASLESFWESHGVLLIPEGFDETLGQSGLDSHRISQWRKFVTYGPKRILLEKHRGVDWAGVRSWGDFAAWTGEYDLALLQHSTAALFSLFKEDEFCVHDPEEIVSIELTRGRAHNVHVPIAQDARPR